MTRADNTRVTHAYDGNNGNPTTTLYLGSVEKVTHPDGSVTVRRRIGGTAIEIEGPAVGSCEADAVRYVLRDHLGSVDGLTNAQGAMVQPMSFAAWGARRDPDDWTGLAGAAAAAFDGCATTRGFTGHEMLDAVGAVHMNGRLYDPALGRFLQADPFVQFPANLQSHNRYSYALNNPLAYTDPSGHFLKGLLRPLASIAISVWLPGAGFWTGTTLFAANGLGAVAVSGSIAGAVGSGSLKGAVVGAFSAAAFHGVGDIGFKEGFTGSSLKALSHGAVGGIASVLGGGRFGHGFVSAGAAQALSGPIGRIGGRFRRTAAAAAVGGTLSAATGGKFANGAITGAFSRAFNDELHSRALSAEGEKLLRSAEGLSLKPYSDRTGEEITAWEKGATIGYGHLIEEGDWAEYKDGITAEKAEALFKSDIAAFVERVAKVLPAKMSQQQFDAAVMLSYNIGAGAFARSSAAALIKDPEAATPYPSLERAWKAWNRVGDSVSRGLENRRNAEWNVYSKGVYEPW